jgi:hypothetical protein
MANKAIGQEHIQNFRLSCLVNHPCNSSVARDAERISDRIIGFERSLKGEVGHILGACECRKQMRSLLKQYCLQTRLNRCYIESAGKVYGPAS